MPLLLRGAVTIGEAIIEEYGKYIIGPAFIKHLDYKIKMQYTLE